MALVPVDSSNQASLYSNNNAIGSIPNQMVSSFAPRSECPIDPKNDLLPPAYASPLVDMKFGPPEQTVKRYFSFTTNDIESFHKEKIKKWIKVYEKVLGHCFRKLREHVLRDQKFCFFPVPEYLPGFPLFNITHCTCFIIKKLKHANFKTKFIPPNVIYINWNVENHYERIIKPDHQPIEHIPTYTPVNQGSSTEKTVHYARLSSEQSQQSYIPQELQPLTTSSNNNRYAFQKQDTFLFG